MLMMFYEKEEEEGEKKIERDEMKLNERKKKHGKADEIS
jgi:hypothetical protein